MQALSSPRALRVSLALASLAVCGAASAASLEYDFSVPTTSTGFTANPSVNRFNPSLGTLLSVTFGLNDSLTSTIGLSNQSNTVAQSIVGTVNGAFTLQNAAGTTNYLSDALTVQRGTGIDGFGTFAVNSNSTPDFSSPYGMAFAAKTVADASNLTAAKSDAATLAAFTGTSAISFLYTATATAATTSDNNNVLFSYVTKAQANGFVIYNYQPTPEPASCAALAIGALGFLRRRKGGTR